MKRINVIGTSGSGKTIFSRKLAEKLGVPHIEMDALFWKSGWEMTGDEEFLAKIEERLRGESWVLDGNYTRSIPVKWKNVETVIWLDYPFWLVASRSLKRALGRIINRTELWEGTGNRETFRQTFLSKDSILIWMITSYPKIKERCATFLDDPDLAHIRFVRIRSPREAEEFIEEAMF